MTVTDIKSYALTFKGRRKVNQDSVISIHRDNLSFIAVADGMGGYKGGEAAAEIAINTCKKFIFDINIEDLKEDQLKQLLIDIFYEIKKQIQKHIQEFPEHASMGTTMSCAIIYNNAFVWANIGDSRLYRFNENRIFQITQDHSLIEEYKNQYGNEVPDYILARSNVITRSMGNNEDMPDIFPIDRDYETLKDKEGLFACSDGLIIEKNITENNWILNFILASSSLQEAAENLISHAFYKGSSDNISVVIFTNGKFKRTGKLKKKYSYPPIETLIYEKKKSQNSYIKKLYLSFLVIIALAISIYYIKNFVFNDEAHYLEQTTETSSTDNELNNDSYFVLKEWSPSVSPNGGVINRESDKITWQHYPDIEFVKEYLVFFNEHEISVDKKSYISLEAYPYITPGIYNFKLKVVFTNMETYKTNQIRFVIH